MKIISYDTNRYPFRKLVSSLYDCALEDLDSAEEKKNLTLGTDTKTAFHRVFYDKLDSGWKEFEDVYFNFIKEVIHPLFEDDVLIYQSSPGIRFNRPGGKAVYKWHADGDSDHKHPLGEVNIFLPLTSCYDTNTMWYETVPGLGDWRPLEIGDGEFLLGYLNQCRHGNKTNTTKHTRVSFDFRVIPGFAYDDSCSLVSCTTKQKFVVGEYYSRIERPTTPDMYDIEENSKLEAAC